MQIKELELRHLVGYLPYELNVKIRQERQISRHEWKWFETENILNPGFLTWNLENITPILHPLSDLTKEFIDSDIILSDFCPEFLIGNISEWNYGFVNRLYELHFDVHQLIENGLAIDINTL